MYAQVEKPKENKSRAVANSTTQKKSQCLQGNGFVDNRHEANTQRKMKAMVNNHSSEQERDVPFSFYRRPIAKTQPEIHAAIDQFSSRLSASKHGLQRAIAVTATPDSLEDMNLASGQPIGTATLDMGVTGNPVNAQAPKYTVETKKVKKRSGKPRYKAYIRKIRKWGQVYC